MPYEEKIIINGTKYKENPPFQLVNVKLTQIIENNIKIVLH